MEAKIREAKETFMKMTDSQVEAAAMHYLPKNPSPDRV